MTKHEQTVRNLGCIVCSLMQRGYVAAHIHHCRFPVGMGQKASQWYAIPLAPAIHQIGMMWPEWPWQSDVPIHAGDRPFRARYGFGERELLWEVWQRLPYGPPVGVDDEAALIDWLECKRNES